MRSIRLSLVFYFLTLLALALGSVGGVGYWTTAEVVRGRREATEKLLKDQYKKRCEREHSRLDNALHFQARTLASLAQFQFQGNRQYLQLLEPLGILSAGPSPQAHLQVPAWIAQGVKGPLAYQVFNLAALEIHFNQDDLPRFPTDRKDVEVQINEYFQITSEWGNTWRSRSMGEVIFPLDDKQFAGIKMFESRRDDYELKPGLKVRRVTLKAPVLRFRYLNKLPHHRPDGGPAGELPAPPGARPGESATPALLIQCAAETTLRDAEVRRLEDELQQRLTDLDNEAAATRAELRDRLLGIGLATFAATVLGGFLLVRHGLSPLRRLSDAVSRVSERDFRLQFDEQRLPGELRPIVERLTQTLEQLQRAFTREKQATADISHELRTPLAALLMTTEVALRKPRSAEEYRRHLADCRLIGQQLSQQVERLLALARLDAGVDTLRPQSIDVAALAQQCADMVRPLAEARSLSLRVKHHGPASLTTDADKLREVLTNLLHNAIEYNRPEGSVELAVARHNGTLEVEVSDTGIGIAPETQAQIFQRFFRADPSRHEAGLHAGLGLAIVKGYVDLMGGAIDVQSAPGKGSTFRLSLPVPSEQASKKDRITTLKMTRGRGEQRNKP